MKQKLTMRPASSSRLPAKVTILREKATNRSGFRTPVESAGLPKPEMRFSRVTKSNRSEGSL